MPYREPYKPKEQTSWFEKIYPFLIQSRWYRKKLGGSWFRLFDDCGVSFWVEAADYDVTFCYFCKVNMFFCSDNCPWVPPNIIETEFWG